MFRSTMNGLKNFQQTQSPIFADWFVNQDPEMLEVTARMFQHWGKRSSTCHLI